MISNEHFFRLSRILEEYHSSFYQMWEMGKPVFNDKIPTACVKFNDGNFLSFEFNPTFWNKLNDYDRAFVICHESLHIILNHGKRLVNNVSQKLANVAMDISIHEIIFNQTLFDIEKLSIKNDIATYDQYLKGTQAKRNESAEYYYEFLLNHSIDVSEYVSLDDHEAYKNLPEEMEVLDKLESKLSDPKTRGDDSSSQSKTVKLNKKHKTKWESVIKKWSKKYLSQNENDQWKMMNRRLLTFSTDLMLPSEYEHEHEDLNRVDVAFYLDTSGSCANLAQRFFDAATSLSPKIFDIKLYCFDTKVYDVSIKEKKLYGFGGTYFNIIENHLQKMPKYPTAVFVITDGYGNRVKPEYPDRWHWFLSTDYKGCIPEKSRVFQLKDFE